MLANIPRFNET